ncbi:MAG: PAS domain-containing protein [Tagaea sp.]|nr:PAS domain-containing protein [Tagaea sp.]
MAPRLLPEMAEAALVVAFGLVLCLGAAWFTAAKHADSRAAAIAAAYEVDRKLADALEAQLALELKIAEMALMRIAAMGGPAAICGTARSEVPALIAIGRDYGGMGLLSVADADGRIVCSDAQLPSDLMSIADRDYFAAARPAYSGAVAFGAPALGLKSGARSIPMAVRLSDPAGGFAGIAAMEIPIYRLVERWERARFKPDGTVALFGANKRLLARSPAVEDEIGQAIANAELWTRFPAERNGQYDVSPSAIDGVPRAVAFRQVAEYPLVVTIGMSLDDALAAWRADAASDMLLLGGSSAFVLAVSALLGWRLRGLRHSRGVARTAQAEAEIQRQAAIEQGRTARRLALVAAKTVNAVVIADPEGRIEWVNASFERITGWSLEEVRGRKPGDVLRGPQTDPHKSAAIRTALAKRKPIRGLNILNYTKSGRPYWNELEIHPVLDDDGALSGFVAVQEDTTERRRREAEIRALNERIALATASSGVGIWTIDAATRRAEWDATVFELLALDPAESVDPRAAFATRIVPADRARFDARLRALIRQGDPLDIEFRIETRAGARRHLHAKGAAHRDADGRIDRVLGTMWDITRTKAVEASLRESRKRAEEANRAKSDFLAMMSHELRTPLNAIIGFSEVIEGEYFGPVGVPRYKGYASDIRRSGHLLLELISGVLDLTKLERSGWDAAPETIELRAVLTELNAILIETASRGGHSLEIDTPAGLNIEADPLLIKQAILNLVSNAVKYTPPGGTIRVGGTRRVDGAVVVSVADDGLGMDPKDATRACEPFVRLHTRRHSDIPGLGIGLTIVRRIVDLHRAKLSIESALGAGTVVSVAFSPDGPAEAA